MFRLNIQGMCILLLLLFVGLSNADDILQCVYEPTISSINYDYKKTNSWHRDKSLYISPYKINLTKEQYIIIDVRTKANFMAYHIPNSYNIPKFKLVSSSIFKAKNVVLVGKGNNYKNLENLLEKLLQKNYKSVQILDGGIDFWKSKIIKSKLTLSEYGFSNIDKLLSGDKNNWIIVDSTQNSKLENYFSNILLIENDMLMNPKTLSKALFKNHEMINNILLILNPDQNFEKIHNLWKQSLSYNIYTIEVDKMHLATNTLIQNKRAISHKKRSDGAKMICSK